MTGRDLTEELSIPPDLEVGVATSAWQVEGDSAHRGRCIWDDFADRPGAIVDGSHADPASRHLACVDQDLDLLSWLGVDGYRFSISWPRVIPDGTGPISSRGLGFYDSLVDGLLARGIAPMPTLYHWDLPSTLQAEGGWPERDTAAHFADYAGRVADRLGDRVTRWATVNEPWCVAFLGHAAGIHAPGRRDGEAAYRAAHHLMLGHAWATQAVRARGSAEVGIVLNLIPALPETDGDDAAARFVDAARNRLFLEPLAGRGLPGELVEATGAITDWTFVQPGDLDAIATPLDWLGQNYYTVARVTSAAGSSAAEDPEVAAYPGAPPLRFVPRPPVTDLGWEIEPDGLLASLRMAGGALPGVALWITENGAAVPETVGGSAVHDPARIDYLRTHLSSALRGRAEGLAVRGFLVWSFLDNLEWAHGWTKRFGLVRVDRDDPTRRPKDSAHWLRARLAARGRQDVGERLPDPGPQT